MSTEEKAWTIQNSKWQSIMPMALEGAPLLLDTDIYEASEEGSEKHILKVICLIFTLILCSLESSSAILPENFLCWQK